MSEIFIPTAIRLERELRDEIDALKAQLREAVRLLMIQQNIDRFHGVVWPDADEFLAKVDLATPGITPVSEEQTK